MSAVAPDGSPVDVYRALPPLGEDALVAEVVEPPATVLDLGAGTGRISHALIARGYSVTAVDDSPAMLAHVRGAETVLADVADVRLPRQFDCVLLASHFVNHGDDLVRRAFLETCAVHVAPRGVLVAEAYPAAFDWRAARSRETRIGDVTIRVLEAEQNGAIVDATVAYELSGRIWQQRFTARMFDDDGLRAELAGAGLRFDRWLDRSRGWFAARRAKHTPGRAATRAARSRSRTDSSGVRG